MMFKRILECLEDAWMIVAVANHIELWYRAHQTALAPSEVMLKWAFAIGDSVGRAIPARIEVR